MKRFNFWCSEIQVAQLKTLSKMSGLSSSECIRRALDEYIESEFDRRGLLQRASEMMACDDSPVHVG